MVTVAFIVLLLVASPSLAVAEKASGEAEDWQTGIVLECEVVSVPTGSSTTGSVSNPDANGARVNASTATHYDNWQRFEIETDTHVYHAVRTLRQVGMFWRSKLAKLTINDPVKYRLEKNRIVILDEDGKQHKLSIVKKIAKRNTLAP